MYDPGKRCPIIVRDFFSPDHRSYFQEMYNALEECTLTLQVHVGDVPDFDVQISL